MKLIVFFASVVTALCAFSTAPVIAGGDVSDVVRARANARAGGGTSGHDAYILKQSGGALSGTKAKAQAKKKAAAKYRARKAAQKKAAAKKRQAAIAAKKKKAAQQREIAARKAKQKRAAARRAAAEKNDQAKSDKSEDATTAAVPSTAAVLTNQDVAEEKADTAANDNSAEVVAANDNDKPTGDDTNVETPTVDNSTVSESAATGECKRFIPEVGKTVSVDC